MIGVAPSSRGFGFAVMREGNVLVDWGVKSVSSGDKNERCLARLAELIEDYRPAAIAMEDCLKASRRARRIQDLIVQFADMAKGEGIAVCWCSKREINICTLKNEDGTKHQIAESLAASYTDQLGFRLPRKRRLWMSEPYQMDIFSAVALAQCYWQSKKGAHVRREPHRDSSDI